MSDCADETENHISPEQKKIMEQRMRECELALSEAERELRGANNARFRILARIEEIKHDIAFITEHMAFSDLLEPYDFSKPVQYSDYCGYPDSGELESHEPDGFPTGNLNGDGSND